MEAGRDLLGRVIWKPGQHVGEPGLRIDIVHLAGFHEGIDGGGAMAACNLKRGEGPILSSDCHTAQGSFRRIGSTDKHDRRRGSGLNAASG